MNYEILKRIAPKSYACFLLKNVDFALTDFQQEGFYCANKGWLAIYYDFEIKPITVDYDKHKNKYVFGIPVVGLFSNKPAQPAGSFLSGYW